MKLAALFAFAAALLFASGARAAEPQPGFWEVKVKIDLPGGTHEQVSTNCMTPEQIRNIGSGFEIPQSPGMTCARTNSTWDGTRLVVRVRCELQAGQSESELAYVFDTPAHYTATMTTKVRNRGREITSSSNMEGRRLGECPAQTKK